MRGESGAKSKDCQCALAMREIKAIMMSALGDFHLLFLRTSEAKYWHRIGHLFRPNFLIDFG